MAKRKAVHAYMDDDPYSALYEFCDEHGISVSTWLQAVAESLPEPSTSLDDETAAISLSAVVERARRLDTNRRRRGRSSK